MTDDRRKQLRSFGLIVGGVFCLIGLYPLLRGKEMNLWLLGPGGFLIAGGLLFPSALSPFERVWMKAGHFLGRVNSFIILSVIYYAVFSPGHLLLRFFAKDDRFGFRTKTETCWIRRQTEDYRETMKRQF